MASRVVTHRSPPALGTEAPLADVAALVTKVRADLGERSPALVFAFASLPHSIADVSEALALAFPDAVVLGSSASGEFVAESAGKNGIAVVAVAGDYRVHARLAIGLSGDVDAAVAGALQGLPDASPDYPHRTAVVLLDALSGKGEEAALLTAARLGPDVKLAGGAAADDLRMVHTTVTLGAVSASDAIVVAVIDSKQALAVGVSHGHVALSGPLHVTRAEGSLLHELDGRPAWEVWKEATRTHALGRGIDVDALSEAGEGPFLLLYEAGLAVSREGPLKIRAPLSRSGSSLKLACGVPEGAVIRITESTPARQLQSASEAARNAKAGIPGVVAGAVVFDCVCRALILGSEFGKAVSAISHELGGVPVGGLETYGEIAMNEGDLSGFHNTTSVVLAFPA